MEKLNLKMVANAFSSKQKVVFQDMERDLTKICEIVELRCDEATITDGELLYDVSFNQVQLVVRPLSDLTKEIEVNGEKFVPIIKLAKIAYPKDSDSYKLIDDYVDLGMRYTFHFLKNDLSFDCKRGFNGKKWDETCFVNNQLQLFEKLFEWQFDVYALIEQGFGVDVNTLNLKS